MMKAMGSNVAVDGDRVGMVGGIAWLQAKVALQYK